MWEGSYVVPLKHCEEQTRSIIETGLPKPRAAWFSVILPIFKNPTTHSANAWLLSSRTLQQDTWHFENSTYWLLQGKIFNILLLWCLKVLFFPHYALLKSKRSWKSSTNSLCLLIKWGQKIMYNFAIVKVCIIFRPHFTIKHLLQWCTFIFKIQYPSYNNQHE